jgi:hypothetical protein
MPKTFPTESEEKLVEMIMIMMEYKLSLQALVDLHAKKSKTLFDIDEFKI